MDPGLRTTLVAGALTGLVGLLGFVLVHTLTVRFLPMLLLEGAVPAVLTGMAAAYGWHHLRGRLPPGLLGGAVYGALLWAPLLALLALALVQGPLGTATSVPDVPTLLRLVAQSLVAVALAAALAFALVRTPAAAKALALAVVPQALLLGATVLLTGGQGASARILVALLALDVVAGVALVLVHRRLAGAKA